MRFHRQHEQANQEEIKRMVDSLPLGLLVTTDENQSVKTGLYNARFEGDRFIIHLGRTDEQTLALLQNKKCKFVFFEALSVIPSFWIDARYGGAINNFFKFLEFDCEARVIEEMGELKEVMQNLLDQFQKERNYEPLDPASDIYRDKFRQICAVELKVVAVKSKWNLGQTKPEAAQINILKQLKLRREGSDVQTATEMEKVRATKQSNNAYLHIALSRYWSK